MELQWTLGHEIGPYRRWTWTALPLRRHGGEARGGGARSSTGAGLDGASTALEQSLGDAGAWAGCGGDGAAERCAGDVATWSWDERGLKLR